jgi:ATP-dependent 26S proteasome regulatory subunit
MSKGVFWSFDQNKDSFWPSTEIQSSLDAGLYRIIQDMNNQTFFKKAPVVTDELIVLPEEYINRILSEIQTFWERGPAFKERGFIHKRGILMYGDPASGKTSLIQLVIKEFIKNNGVALFGNSAGSLYTGLQIIRNIEPDRPIVVILEDLDTLLNSGESGWLSILDGELQVNKVVYLATTNYIEKIDKRFTDRPSRFDLIMPVKMPSAKARAVYLLRKEPTMSFGELQDWVHLSQGFSMGHLKEMIISVKCLGMQLNDVVTRMKRMQERNFSNEDFKPAKKSKVGFGGDVLDTNEIIDWGEFKQEYMNV